jgi:Response regulator containing CheY-like receiver, AAA-type ATPase, and DNA-binding domains
MAGVLVIDDTKNIRILLTQCLKFEGYDVMTAGGGAEALRLLAGNAFDLIFLDVRMPELSGTEVLRQMRQMGVNTPVVMITAFGTVKNAVECTQLGAVAYLQKPFTENKVKQVLEEVLHFKPERSKLDNILALADEQIKSSRLSDAELLLKNALPEYFLEPRVYSMLTDVYLNLGKTEQAEQCRRMAAALNPGSRLI